MRLWMCDPKILCRKHLLGEHVECHMFFGTLIKKKSMSGYIKNNLFEPLMLFERHKQLAEEICRRGFKHKSPMFEDYNVFDYLPEEELNYTINREKSLRDLLSRCDSCKNQLEENNNDLKKS